MKKLVYEFHIIYLNPNKPEGLSARNIGISEDEYHKICAQLKTKPDKIYLNPKTKIPQPTLINIGAQNVLMAYPIGYELSDSPLVNMDGKPLKKAANVEN